MRRGSDSFYRYDDVMLILFSSFSNIFIALCVRIIFFAVFKVMVDIETPLSVVGYGCRGDLWIFDLMILNYNT